MPGIPNRVSMTTAPAKMRPVCRPNTVTTGRSALRRACRQMTASSRIPLARAVRT